MVNIFTPYPGRQVDLSDHDASTYDALEFLVRMYFEFEWWFRHRVRRLLARR